MVLLDSKTNNYLVGLAVAEDEVGLAYVDISTSEFATTQLPRDRAVTELERLHASEIIAAEDADLESLGLTGDVTRIESYYFEQERARQTLLDHFDVVSLEGYGCAHLSLAVKAAGAIVHYIEETQKGILAQITGLTTYSSTDFMALDTQTQRNLELFRGAGSESAEGSLLSVIDLTRTPMGGRLLRKWLGQPLL